MVTAELLYRAFGAVVASLKTRVSYIHDTDKILDRSSGINWPACGWKLPTEGMEPVAEVFSDTFTLSLLFVEQTASDRTSLEMLTAHTRMAIIAKMCFRKFAQLYITNANEYEGVELDLELIGNPILPPVWDDGETMLTGVTMSFTVKATQEECLDAYFQ